MVSISTATTSSGATAAAPSTLVPSSSPLLDTTQPPAISRDPSRETTTMRHFWPAATPVTEALSRTQPAAGTNDAVSRTLVAGSTADPTRVPGTTPGTLADGAGVGSTAFGAGACSPDRPIAT